MDKGQATATGFTDLWDQAYEYGKRYQSEYGSPICSVLGCSSERFDQTVLEPDYCQPNWLSENAAWDDLLLKVFQYPGGLDEEMAREFLQTKDIRALTSKLEFRAQAHLQSKDYYASGQLLQTLVALQGRDLPGFRCGSFMSQGGEDDVLDMRFDKKFGAGRRLLLEVAFLWD
ncbi:hypothetical protein Q8W33_19950 [Shimia thalassica]|nr:hypothetical protein [Shimia thalassica]